MRKFGVMLQLSKIFWDICRLKSGPQALPIERYILVVVVFAGIIVDSVSSSILIPKLTNYEISRTVIIYNIVLLTAVYFLLKLLGYAERGLQTLMAIAGSGLFISLVLMPALLMLNTSTQAIKPFGLLILVDSIWRIAVNAHIFRHALSINRLLAMIISISYLLFGVLIAEFLLPTDVS